MHSRLAWLCAAASLAALHVAAGTLSSTNSSFVDALKRNLRINNDDYAEELKQNSSSPRAPLATTAHPALAPGNETRNTTLASAGKTGDNRRAGGERYWEFEYDETTIPSTARNYTAPASAPGLRSVRKLPKSRFLHVKRNISRLQNEIKVPYTNVVNSNTLRLKYLNEEKIDKFKKFMKKNKHLLGRVSGRDAQADGGEPEERMKRKSKKGDLRNVLDAWTMEWGAAAEEAAGQATLPDPELLDMAPARGGRIHRLRAKGRLCQRHVLLPEGPKYDSNGRWYVPEHRLVARYRYDVTARPGLLLPRCCNCCKKSVLGCE